MIFMPVVLFLVAMHVRAVEFCPPAGCPEPTPTVQYVNQPYTVNVTRMVPVEREVTSSCGRWVTERRQVPTTKTVYVNEPYTVNVTRYRNQPETRTRQRTRTVRETEVRQVNETVYDRVCDPVTGRQVRVARNVCRNVTVPVKRKVCVDEQYTVRVRVPYTAQETRTRRVAKTVPSTREVCERRWVEEPVTQRVTTMQPVVETQTQYRQTAVCVTPAAAPSAFASR